PAAAHAAARCLARDAAAPQRRTGTRTARMACARHAALGHAPALAGDYNTPARMLRLPVPSISLASKCRTLFGSAVILIVGAALMVPWLRMTDLVHEKNFQTARRMAIVAAQRGLPSGGDLTTRQRATETRQRALDEWWRRNAAAFDLPVDPVPELIVVDPLYPRLPAYEDEYLRQSVLLLARQPGMQNAPQRVSEDPPGRLVYRHVQAVRSQGEG